jgi:hypothetical protein
MRRLLNCGGNRPVDHAAPAATAGGGTAVTIETFYTPANPGAAVLNRLVMRRRFRRVVDELLDGLRTLAERRLGKSNPGSAAPS